MSNPAVLTLYVARHGETDYNRRRLMQGRRIDASLNARGFLQAEALGERMRGVELDAIRVSPLLRARQTAREVALHHPDAQWIEDEDLAEMSWGELEGRSIDDVGDELRQFARRWRDGHFDDHVGGGESIRDVEVRVQRVLERVHAAGEGRAELLVTHGRYMRVLLATALGEGLETMDRFGHANTGIYRLRFDGTRFDADLWNCVRHLEAVEETA